jgi:hypothetical protein
MDSMQTQRNRRSPRVPNQPWRGPGNLTIPQIVALFCAFVVAVALWWVSGYLPGSASFGVLAGRMILTGFVGGIAAVLCYAAADPTREPAVRQHMTYSFRRHTYRKEPAHGTHADPLPFPARRPHAAGSSVRRARAGRAHIAAALRAIIAALPGRHAGHGA